MLVGTICLVLPATGSCADDSVPRLPVFSCAAACPRLNRDGDAWARPRPGGCSEAAYVAHLLYLAKGGSSIVEQRHVPPRLKFALQVGVAARRCDKNGDGSISLEEFGRPERWFRSGSTRTTMAP